MSECWSNTYWVACACIAWLNVDAVGGVNGWVLDEICLVVSKTVMAMAENAVFGNNGVARGN